MLLTAPKRKKSGRRQKRKRGRLRRRRRRRSPERTEEQKERERESEKKENPDRISGNAVAFCNFTNYSSAAASAAVYSSSRSPRYRSSPRSSLIPSRPRTRSRPSSCPFHLLPSSNSVHSFFSFFPSSVARVQNLLLHFISGIKKNTFPLQSWTCPVRPISFPSISFTSESVLCANCVFLPFILFFFF